MGIVEKDRERYRKIFGERDKQKDYWVHSVCSLCYNECANRVRVLDGKPVAAEGVPESDKGAQGGLCAKGVTAIMDWHNPNRILYPVKRTNPKKGLHEDPKWERITWEEALDTITEKLIAARKKDPRSTVFAMTPGPHGRHESQHYLVPFYSGLRRQFPCLRRSRESCAVPAPII